MTEGAPVFQPSEQGVKPRSMRFQKMRLAACCFLAFAVAAAPVSAATTTYYHNDVLGSPVVATDVSGNVLWKENYRPYGDKPNNISLFVVQGMV